MTERRRSTGGLRRDYLSGDLSPTDVVRNCIDNIASVDPALGAFTQVLAERATMDAARLERALADDHRIAESMPLFGVPVAIKEIVDVAGARVTGGSVLFRDRVARGDAPLVARLRAAGAMVVGMTRSHEFAWGITTQHESMGRTVNPWNPSRIPGGSSGGSAAAVAAGLVPVALGTDTAGSIRIPAGFCGVVGFKPTFGTLELTGVIPLAGSLDVAGPIGSSVEDATLAFAALSGAESPAEPRARIVFAISPDLDFVEADAYRQTAFGRVVDEAAAIGDVVEVSIPGARSAMEIFRNIQQFEAYRIHADVLGTYPERAAEYGADVRRRLELAALVTEDDYRAAQRARASLRHEVTAAFEVADAILMPSSAAGPSETSAPDVVVERGRTRPLRDVVLPFTSFHNVLGIPSCSIPVGLDADGLPMGVQVAAAAGDDFGCLEAARALESVLGFEARPGLSAPEP